MRGAYRVRRWLAPAALGLGTILAAGCQDRLPTRVGESSEIPLRITASVVGTPIATLVVTVTAVDISGPLVFNLSVENGVAAGTIKVPPGPARYIWVTAMDAEGNVTHEGGVSVDVRPGQNPVVNLKLTPRSGHVPIIVTLGSYGVEVTPTTASIAVGAKVQLAATVRDVDGHVIDYASVEGATSQPSVATVSYGLVIGQATGTATIVATYEGVAALSDVTVTPIRFGSLSPGEYHTCGLTLAGLAYCWGAAPAIGDGTQYAYRFTPTQVVGGRTFASLSAGGSHTCGVTPGGLAYCWGWNGGFQLGDGTQTDRPTPTAVGGGLTFASVTAGLTHTCALTKTGAAYCWGSNYTGQLGDGTSTTRSSPVPAGGGLTFASLSAGAYHTCGLVAGEAYCWGANDHGQLGGGTAGNQTVTTPVKVAGGLSFTSLSAGGDATCGLTAGGVAYCWGGNFYGAVGDGSTTYRASPVPVGGGLTFANLSVSDFSHACGVTLGGVAYCWGLNTDGQLGDGTTANELSPVVVREQPAFASVRPGGFHTCGLTGDGAAYCWGANYTAQLGDGTYTARLTPVAVTSPSGYPALPSPPARNR